MYCPVIKSVLIWFSWYGFLHGIHSLRNKILVHYHRFVTLPDANMQRIDLISCFVKFSNFCEMFGEHDTYCHMSLPFFGPTSPD